MLGPIPGNIEFECLFYFRVPEIRCWEEIWPDFTCLRVSENLFGNPETSKIQTNNMRARPDTWHVWGSMNAAQIECNWTLQSREASWVNAVQKRQRTVCGCENVLHECRGSERSLNIEALGTSVQKFIGSIHARKLPAWCDTVLCKSRKYLKLLQKKTTFQLTMAVIVEYWKYWVGNSAPYAGGLCSHF